jgi:hypothetical protein
VPAKKPVDDMKPEYDFDYSKARHNPYAERLRGHTVAVVLAPDVAPSFPTSESVNEILRAVIKAVPKSSAPSATKRSRSRLNRRESA